MGWANCGEAESDRSCYETMSPSLVPVNRLLKQRDELAALCGEMIATLSLPRNADAPISKLGEILDRWHKRFEASGGNPRG